MKPMYLSILAPLALLCSGCDQNGLAADGYKFEQKEFERTEQTITFVAYDTHAKLSAAAKKHGIVIPQGRKIKAFALIYKGRCEIHGMDPEVDYQPEFIGHELIHCLYGRFHPKQNK